MTNKHDSFIENYPEEKFRKYLMLNEPPNFFNPFIENTGNNNFYFNPHYTNDRSIISLNTNRYLIDRFFKANFEVKGRYYFYLSKEESFMLKKLVLIQNFLFLSTIFSVYQFYKRKDFRFLFVSIFNLGMIGIGVHRTRFVIYNSYIRNFNGYTDEQIDYIITCNQERNKKYNEKI